VAGYGVIKGTADDQVKVPTGAGQACEGVVAETGAASAADKPVTVIRDGETLAIAGGVVNRGDWVKMDTNGKFVATTTPNDECAGRAVSSAAADTDEFVLEVNIQRY